MKANDLQRHSKFAFSCDLYERSNFVWSKKVFVFTVLFVIRYNGTFLITTVFKQKLDFVMPYLRAIRVGS
jgi:hypothetical protein